MFKLQNLNMLALTLRDWMSYSIGLSKAYNLYFD